MIEPQRARRIPSKHKPKSVARLVYLVILSTMSLALVGSLASVRTSTPAVRASHQVSTSTPTAPSALPNAPADGPVEVIQGNNHYFLKIDLDDSRVRIRVGLANNDQGGFQNLNGMADRYRGQGYAQWAIINGDYFSTDRDNPCPFGENCAEGLTYIDGQHRPNWSEYGTTWPVRGNLGLDSARDVEISVGNSQTKRHMVIGGGPRILIDGTPTCSGQCNAAQCGIGKIFYPASGECFNGCRNICGETGASTMLGYSGDGRYLYMGVSFNGNLPYNSAEWLRDRGARQVLKMDSGGSSGLIYNNNVILPTDGRGLPNHLALIVTNDPPPTPTPPPCQGGDDHIVLYANKGFDPGGGCVTLGVGEYSNSGALGNVGNDNAESIRVGSNVRAELCKHNDYGECETFSGDDGDLGDNPVGGNSVSSVKVQMRPCDPGPDQVALYANTGFGRPCVILGVGEYPNPGYLGSVGNDNAESVKVGSDVQAELCRHNDYVECETFQNDDDNLEGNYIGRNSTSSVKVQRRRVNNAQYLEQSVPTTLIAGQRADVWVKVKNTGNTMWTAGEGYKLGSENPADNSTWGLSRVQVPHDVPPGGEVTFNFTITAPTQPGLYNFQWRMLREGVEWFGQSTENRQIEVQQAAQVVSPLSLSPGDPYQYELVRASFKIKNVSSQPVTFIHLLVAVRGPDCSDWDCGRGQDFPSVDNLTLQPGTEFYYSGEARFSYVGGGYFAEPVYEDASGWHSFGGRINFSVTPGLEVTQQLDLSPPNPDQFAPVTATFKIKNSSPRPIRLHQLVVAARGPDCADWGCNKWADFPAVNDITLSPGQEYSFNKRRTFDLPGAYFAQIGYSFGADDWYFATAERTNFTVSPVVTVTQPLAITPATPLAGELVTATFTIKNVSSKSVTLNELMVAAKGPNCTDWACPNYADFPHERNVVLQPNQEYQFLQKRAFSQPGSGYFAEPAFMGADGIWHPGLPGAVRVNFSVAPGIQIVSPAVISPASPIAGEEVTIQYSVHNAGSRAIALRRIGAVARGPNCSDWDCSGWGDFPFMDDVVVQPGQTLSNVTLRRPFIGAGNGYFAEPAFMDTNQWWYALPTQSGGSARIDFSVGKGLEVLQGLSISPIDPLVGEIVTGQFAVRNSGSRSITVPELSIVARGPNCTSWDCGNWSDFPRVKNLTLTAGQQYTFTQTRTFLTAGPSYFAEMAIAGTNEWWYSLSGGARVTFTVSPGLQVISPLTLTPSDPIAGELVTASYRIKNVGTRLITIPKLSVLARGPNCKDLGCAGWADFHLDENVALAPGQEYSYSRQRAFIPEGSGYFAEPGINDPNDWWSLFPGGARVGFTVAPGLQMQNELTITPPDPQAGEVVTAQYTLKNVGPRSVTLPKLGIMARGPDCTSSGWNCGEWSDFPPAGNVTILPGKHYTFVAQRPFLQVGSGYKAQPAYADPYDWTYEIASSARRNFAVGPGLQLTEPMVLFPAVPTEGEMVTGSYRIKNLGTRAIKIRRMGIIARGPDCLGSPCNTWADFETEDNVTLQPGEERLYTKQRSFAPAGAGYFAEPQFNDANEWWYMLPGGSRFIFSVRPECNSQTSQFSDVPPDSPFYIYVGCLACRSILGGYSDGTFRPNNQVTRGQLSKIVSNASGFNDDPGAQMFADIALGSPFYEWVNRLTNRGIMGGYPCGGPGESCNESNLPYFRPGANATRGQISKIVANSANYTDTPQGQSFEDVAPNSPFYLWIMLLSARSFVGGYPCGGPGEPCKAGNLPYFRPNNNATRGQTSKIVANTFFPSCQTPARK